MHLVLSSLGQVLADMAGVNSVQAEDASGSFGLWPGHTDLLCVLSVGVLSWRTADDGPWRYAAVRGGVLTLQRGCELRVASREAFLGDDLARLQHQVIDQLRQRQLEEDNARRQSRHLEVQVLQQLVGPLKSSKGQPGTWP
jgi:F-type H+-transporting ATPase subunit epsilon